MNIVCIDDESLALERLVDRVKKVIPDASIYSFNDEVEVIPFLKDKKIIPDLIFSDIEMTNLNGVDLGARFKEIYPSVKVVMVTGFSEYAAKSYSLHIDGYILKPVTEEAIRDNVNFLFKNTKDLVISCFGNFEVFYKGEIVHFARSKAKELLAYLVDRKGNGATTKECIQILFGDRYDTVVQRNFSSIVSTLKSTLKEIGCEDVLKTSRMSYSVDETKFDCDFYDVLEDHNKLSKVSGKYMENYEWATTYRKYFKDLKK